MARIERTYSQEKVKQMLKLNEVLLDYLQRELPSDAVFLSKTDKRVCHKSMAHPLLCYLLYNPRSIVAYSKKGII